MASSCIPTGIQLDLEMVKAAGVATASSTLSEASNTSASSSATSSVASVFPPPRLLGLTSALADDPRCSDLLAPFPILD